MEQQVLIQKQGQIEKFQLWRETEKIKNGFLKKTFVKQEDQAKYAVFEDLGDGSDISALFLGLQLVYFLLLYILPQFFLRL